MTPQEVFDKVAGHLLTQGSKAMATMRDGSIGCAYRANDGKRCALGCLISDDCYDQILENSLAELIVSGNPPPFLDDCTVEDRQKWFSAAACIRQELGDVEEVGDLIERLQSVHDDYDENDWRERLGYVADDFSLAASVLDEMA